MQFGAPAHHPHDQHVRISPVPRTVERQPTVLREPDAAYTFPCIADVSRRAPAVRITQPDRSVAIGRTVREAEDDVTVEFAERIMHFPDMIVVQWMPVVFQVVDFPFAPLFHICIHEGVGAMMPNLASVIPVVTVRFLITVVLVVQPLFDPLVFTVRTV